jgi:thioredoxin reductase (NADPH)
MNKDPKVENLVIVGGGAAGLAAAIYAARAEINPLVIEGMPPGGQLMLTSEVENYPGFPEGVAGTELIGKFRKQAEKFGTRFITDSISSVKVSGENSNRIITVRGPTLADVQTKTLLVATGADAMWLGLESEQRLRGKGVSACATCDGFFFRDKVVAVLGGGDTALEEATFITKFAQKVYIIHRRAEFRASKFMQSKALNNPKIEPIYNATVEEVLGEEKVTGVRLQLNSKYETISKSKCSK